MCSAPSTFDEGNDGRTPIRYTRRCACRSLDRRGPTASIRHRRRSRKVAPRAPGASGGFAEFPDAELVDAPRRKTLGQQRQGRNVFDRDIEPTGLVIAARRLQKPTLDESGAVDLSGCESQPLRLARPGSNSTQNGVDRFTSSGRSNDNSRWLPICGTTFGARPMLVARQARAGLGPLRIGISGQRGVIAKLVAMRGAGHRS